MRNMQKSFFAGGGGARNSGQRNGARAGLLGNMAAKHSKEMGGEGGKQGELWECPNYGNVKVANNVLILSNIKMRTKCCNLTSL